MYSIEEKCVSFTTKVKVEAQKCRYIHIIHANAILTAWWGFVVLNL